MKTIVDKNSIIFLLTTSLIMTIGSSELNQSFSQLTSENLGNQQAPTLDQFNDSVPTQQNINWNQSLIVDPTNVFCDDAGECGGIVEVAFESNNTLVLESYNSYRIFDVADMAKNLSGFQIVDTSTTPQEGGIKYLVVMSK